MDACRFLRPSLSRAVKGRPCQAYLRFFAASSKVLEKPPAKGLSDYAKRIDLLARNGGIDQSWPRLSQRSRDLARAGEQHVNASIADVRQRAAQLDNDATVSDSTYTIYGRVKSVRALSSKLVFLVLEQEGHEIQVLCSLSRLAADEESKKRFRSIARKGDWFSVVGHPHKTARGEPSLLASELPILQSPSLHQVPATLGNDEIKAQRPHVGMLVDPAEVQTLRVRSRIETLLAQWFEEQQFIKVQTPILAADAGGATARPFRTVATELSSTDLSLRIAPELWLKRLVLGGLGKVYELGPAFRNEGVDNTHNPEFTMCEFYWPFQTLEQLMGITESIFHMLHEKLSIMDESTTRDLPDSIIHKSGSEFPTEFNRLPFIPTLEREMGCSLPGLERSDARDALLELFSKLSLPVRAHATVPALLDDLCAQYVEPLCEEPTFITEHPAALSPLAKTFRCPTTNQLVSARAELFINGREYANMYEEENSPFKQRKKFEAQLQYRKEVDPGATGEVDESYLEALEWGLPPTGGWGLGVDRLVMLFTGRKRIADVLPFGTLRNVVGIHKVGTK